MPRLDAPGLLHHIISRGIERRDIFNDKSDYEDFLNRIESSLEKSPNQILAWALMPNHVHLLVRSGRGGIVSFMRRLMAGYATAFNVRHRRVGYLFQNRYKSIICDEGAYLLQLVRYIHLNPLRAGIVKDLSRLKTFPYTGHGVLMGIFKRPWQETDEILSLFGKTFRDAKQKYEKFALEGIKEGKRPDLTGGGLLRSHGGLKEVLQMKRSGDRELSDARILGPGYFVESVLSATEQKESLKQKIRRKKITLEIVAEKIGKQSGIDFNLLFKVGRTEAVSRGKALLTYIGVEYLGETTRAMGCLTRMSDPAASKARGRGEKLFSDSGIADWLKVN